MTELRRPRHISAADWQRMPWHARERAVRVVVTGDVSGCGTPAGYMRHYRAREAACVRCLEAWRIYTRARKAEQRERERRGVIVRAVRDEVSGLQPCGTRAAFVRHKDSGETPCDLCREAERTYQRIRSRQRRAAAKRRSAPAAEAARAQVAS